MKYLLLMACLMIAGCGGIQRSLTHWTGDLTYKCARNGVEYVQSDSGLAAHYNPDGTLVKCKE